MTSTPSTYTIQQGLPHILRQQAAELYSSAFERKFRPFFGPRAKSISLVSQSLQPDLAFVAVRDQKLLGLAGIQFAEKRFVDVKRRTLISEFGGVSGLLRHTFMELFFARPHEAGVLLMDGIAVRDEARGQGIGTALLEAVYAYAATHHFSSVRLDVIDTNPRARKLYESFGFVSTRTSHFPFLKSLLGFSAVTTMVKRLPLSVEPDLESIC